MLKHFVFFFSFLKIELNAHKWGILPCSKHKHSHSVMQISFILHHRKVIVSFFFKKIIVSILQNHLTIVLYNILHFIIQHIKIIKNKSRKSERGRINYKTNLSQVWNNAMNTIIFIIFFTTVELTSFLLLVLI